MSTVKEAHKSSTAKGLKWNLLDKVVGQGVGLIINIMLARLLLPEEFGLLGMVVVVIGFAGVFKDFGLGSAIIQKKSLSAVDLSSVFWLNTLMGALLTIIVYLSGPYVSAYYEIELLQPITELLSVTYFIGALNIVQLSLLRRSMDFRRIFMVNASATLVSGLVAITVAFLGGGVWSLVWKMILFVIVTNMVLWLSSSWRPKLEWSRESIKGIMGFSLPLLGTQSLNYWVRNADNLLIGKYLGSVSLGVYNQSYRIMLIPVTQITGVVSNVLFPSLAQIQDDDLAIKAIYLKVTRLLSFLTFPIMFGLCALAEPFVEVVLGEEWLPMTTVLRYLSLVGALQSIGTLNGNVFQAKGKTAYQLWVGIPPRLIVLGAIVLGLPGGIENIALNYLIVTPLLSIYLYFFMGRLIKLNLLEIVSNLLPNLFIAAVMGVSVYFFYVEVVAYLNILLSFLSSVFLGVGLYTGLSYVFNNAIFLEAFAAWKLVKKK